MPSFASSLKEKEKQSSLSLPKVKKKNSYIFFFSRLNQKVPSAKKKKKKCLTESLIQETAKNGRKKDSLDRRLPAKKKKRFPVPSRKLMHCLTRHAHMHVRQQPKQRRQQKQKQTKKKGVLFRMKAGERCQRGE